jgi:hypothetical protein
VGVVLVEFATCLTHRTNMLRGRSIWIVLASLVSIVGDGGFRT